MSTRVKLVMAALVLAGVGLFAVAGLVGDDDPDDISVSGTDGLIAISPRRGAEALQQQKVSVTLEVPWEFVSMRLFDNDAFAAGVDVSAYVRQVAGNEWVYEPADGLPWERHSADDNCVIVEFENIADGQVDDIDWCFTAS